MYFDGHAHVIKFVRFWLRVYSDRQAQESASEKGIHVSVGNQASTCRRTKAESEEETDEPGIATNRGRLDQKGQAKLRDPIRDLPAR